MRRAWILNLDAELELLGRTPNRALAERLAEMRTRLARALPEGDVVLDHEPDADVTGFEGDAWSLTPGAVSRLRKAGAVVVGAASGEVLRLVNDRAFAFGLAHLPGARVCESVGDAEDALRRPGRWLARRGLAFAGRGVRRIDDVGVGDRAFLEASLRVGTLVVEPRVSRELDVALHGHTDGRTGALTIQDIDASGQWAGSYRAGPGALEEEELQQLRDAFEETRRALVEAGYQGPFGIDAFRWRRADGVLFFHPLSEINARYSMGWPVGMGGF